MENKSLINDGEIDSQNDIITSTKPKKIRTIMKKTQDNENPETIVATPKRRVTKKKTEEPVFQMEDDIPSSFSTNIDDDLAPKTLSYKYTNSYKNQDQEEWSPNTNMNYSQNTPDRNTNEDSPSPEYHPSFDERPIYDDRPQQNRRNNNRPQQNNQMQNRDQRPQYDQNDRPHQNNQMQNREQRPQYDQNDRYQRNNQNNNQRNIRNNDQRNNQNYSQNNRNQNNNRNQGPNNNQRNNRFVKQVRIGTFSSGMLKSMQCFDSMADLEEIYQANIDTTKQSINFSMLHEKTPNDLFKFTKTIFPEFSQEFAFNKSKMIEILMAKAVEDKAPIIANGVLESIEGGDGLIVYANDNYRIRPHSAFVPKILIRQYGLRRGQDIECCILPATQNATCPYVVKINSVLGCDPNSVQNLPKFKDLTPYYPKERLFLESTQPTTWDNNSMRIVDLLTPIGLGQRGMIVAQPRTGKTVLLQCIANAISLNRPDVKLMILLVDERPEEVTDFCRQVPKAEIISSTFDESADNHIHAADMVIDKARRYVEAGQHVVILLDSITRLARAHNTELPNSGKLLSGGIDSNALQAPKKFFGSARNIEGGGSLTIMATALIETGSKMDDVIFEEFKGTGNMELHLDRTITDKRIYPGINFEKSGTRKEELLYHPDEMEKIIAIRRAMQGIQPTEAIEMLLKKIKTTKSNMEFLLGVNR